MTSHYFNPGPGLDHEYRQIEYRPVPEVSLRLGTDAGVFAKRQVDFGSDLLIKSFLHAPVGSTNTACKFLDLGCGYGPIALSIKQARTCWQVYACDINLRALELAKKNANLNRLSIELAQADGIEASWDGFDYILTNPPIRAGKDTVFRFYQEAEDKLVPGGELWLVIQKKQGAKSSWRRLQELFASVEKVDQASGYQIYRCRKGASL